MFLSELAPAQNIACESAENALTEGMDNARQMRNLTLIGFMGTGKSSVGRLVADQLHFTFLDTDAVIEARAGASIDDIFKPHRYGIGAAKSDGYLNGRWIASK